MLKKGSVHQHVTVDNKVVVLGCVEVGWEYDGSPVVFGLQVNDQVITVGIENILECLWIAEKNIHVPSLEEEWWVSVLKRYYMELEPLKDKLFINACTKKWTLAEITEGQIDWNHEKTVDFEQYITHINRSDGDCVTLRVWLESDNAIDGKEWWWSVTTKIYGEIERGTAEDLATAIGMAERMLVSSYPLIRWKARPSG